MNIVWKKFNFAMPTLATLKTYHWKLQGMDLSADTS